MDGIDELPDVEEYIVDEDDADIGTIWLLQPLRQNAGEDAPGACCLNGHLQPN